MNATTPNQPHQQDAVPQYPSDGKKKVFTLAPVQDDLTSVILSVRIDVIEDSSLDLGARLMFVYLLDLSLRRSVNIQPGVITISLTHLAQKFGVSERTIWTWKRQLIEGRRVWMSFQKMPNTWPVDTYHVSAIHPQNYFSDKVSAEGMWGNGRRRDPLPEPGQGARQPGQQVLPGTLRRNPLPRTKTEAQKSQVIDIAMESRNPLRPSVEAHCDRESQPTATVGRSPLRPTVETGCDGESKQAATHGRNRLRPTVETGCEHKKALGTGSEASIGRGGDPPPPDEQFQIWLKGLDGMFPSKLRKLETDLQRRLGLARSDEARKEWKRRLAAVQERLLGGAVEDTPKPKEIATPPPPADPSPEEILEGARYLVSIGKKHLLTRAQRAALKEATR